MSSERLKEQDALIQLARQLSEADGLGIRGALKRVQELLVEHRAASTSGGKQQPSQLQQLCPGVGKVFLELDLLQALEDYDHTAHVTRRRFVPASFGDLRKVLNLATVRALGWAPKSVGLVTLDADDTIYNDGGVLTLDSPMISVITRLMVCGLHVGIVTAASYPGDPGKFEARLAGLLAYLAYAIDCGAPETILDRFHVMGGQCNYLYRAGVSWDSGGDKGPRVHLIEVPAEEWKDHRGTRWDHGEVQKLLDTAEQTLRETSAALELDVLLIRKERAVGIVSRNVVSAPLSYEVLEEAALAVQAAIVAAGLDSIPHCAFNGGKDVFVDIGHKALGIRALQGILGVLPEQTVHCGDRFTLTGNDRAARDVANTLWVASPAETEYLLTLLQQHMRDAGRLRPRVGNVTVAASASAGGLPSPGAHSFASAPGGGRGLRAASSGSASVDGGAHGVVGTPELGPHPSPSHMGLSSQAAFDVVPGAAPGDIAGSVVPKGGALSPSLHGTVGVAAGVTAAGAGGAGGAADGLGIAKPVSPAATAVGLTSSASSSGLMAAAAGGSGFGPTTSSGLIGRPTAGPLSAVVSSGGIVGPGIGSPKYGAPQLHPLHLGGLPAHGVAGVHSAVPALSPTESGLPGQALAGTLQAVASAPTAAHGSHTVPPSPSHLRVQANMQVQQGLGGEGLGQGHDTESPQAYGGALPRHGKEAEQRLADQLRSQWVASGGTVVADIRPPVLSARAMGPVNGGAAGASGGAGGATSTSPQSPSKPSA